MKRIKAILVLTALLSGGISYAQEGGSLNLSLSEARDHALKNNLQVKNANVDVNMAKKKVNETTAIGLPRLYGSVDYNNFIDIPTQVIPANAFDPNAPSDLLLPVQFGTEQSLSAGLTLNQLIFDGTYIVGLQAAKVYVKASENGLKKTELEIKDAVTQAYYTVLVARENKRILSKSLKNLETTLKETEAMYEQGMIDETNVDQLKLSKTNLLNSIENAEKQADVALQLLKFQLGAPISSSLELKDSLAGLIDAVNEESISGGKFDVNNHIDYQTLSTQENLAALNLKSLRFSRLPTFSAFLTHSQNAFSNSFSFFGDQNYFPTTILGAKITIPIFDSFGTTAKVKQAGMDLKKVQNLKMMTEQSLQLQVATAQTELKSAWNNYKLEKENLELSEKILNRTRIKHREGVSTSLELSQTQTQHLTTQGQYINSIFQLLSANQKLDKALSK